MLISSPLRRISKPLQIPTILRYNYFSFLSLKHQISNKQFGIRHKLAKQTQPELYAKFIEAKKALHASDASEEESKPNSKRCYLTKEERIARKEQRLKLQQAAKKEEVIEAEDDGSVVHPICPLLPASPTVNVKEAEEQPKKSCLRREEVIHIFQTFLTVFQENCI